jgi:hypothetical protein
MASCRFFYLLFAAHAAISMSVPRAKGPPDYSDIIITPGPGLPTLESLNMTVADLFALENSPEYRRDFERRMSSSSALSKRANARCENPSDIWGIGGAPPDLALAVHWYLYNLGSTPCVASEWGTIFVTAQSGNYAARVEAWSGTGAPTTSSCIDASWAVGWVRENCCQLWPGHGYIGCNGQSPAWGNFYMDILTWGWGG